MPEDYLPELKEILKTALQQSPDLVAKEFERIVQEARITQVRASMLPQLGGSFNYGISQTATAGNTDTQTRDSGFFYNFGLSQAVFHWGALKNQTEAAKLSLLATEKSYALFCREVSLKLRKAYLALIVERARLRQGRESLRLIENDVAIAKTKKEAGVISGAVLAGEEIRYREANADLQRAELEFAANRSRFGRLAGLPGKTIDEEKIPLEIPKPAYSEPLATGMTAILLRENAKSTLEYGIYDLRVREAILRQKIEATRLLPKFGASAGYSLTNTTNVNGNVAEQKAVTQQSIGLGGSWSIFDGLATRGVKREALASRRSAEYQKAVSIDQLLQDAQSLERVLKVDAEQVELSDIRRGTAAEARRMVEAEAGFGHMPKAEVDRARIGVMLAEARNFEVRAGFFGHWCDFVAITGNDPVLNTLPARYVRAKK